MSDIINTTYHLEHYLLQDDGRFPNNDRLPLLIYRGIFDMSRMFAPSRLELLFRQHDWSNPWEAGVYEYHHYHSNTHELLAVYKGDAQLQLGGEQGITVAVKAGDAIIIPAGVAHKNLGKENDITCVGAYPGGRSFDMNYGKPGERPQTDLHIRQVPIPGFDPILGDGAGLKLYWK